GVVDCFRHWWLILRCSWIGGGIGSIPGISASVVDWLAYGHALKTEKGANKTFGKGDVRGVIASESSNNAKEGGALVPTVAFEAPRQWGDLYSLLAFGMLGWIMKQFKWPRPPLILGVVLGDTIERYLFISVERYGISWFARPVVAILFIIAIIGLVRPFLQD